MKNKLSIKNILKEKYGIIIILVSGILITLGLIQGQFSQVLQKAVRVCLECIGIG